MEKRVFLAIFLSFVVLVVYQAYFAPPPTVPPGKSRGSGASSAPATSSTSTPQPGSTSASPTVSAESPAPGAEPAAGVPTEAPARDIVVETDDVTAVFTTRGAVLKNWKLKHYFDVEHRPLDLVPFDVPDTFPKPLTLATDDPAISSKLRSADYTPSADSLSLGHDSGTLEFDYQDGSGLAARKTFQFRPDGKAYVLSVDASVLLSGKPQPVGLEWGPGIGLGYNPDGSRPFPMRAIQFGTKIERLSASNLQKQSRYEGVYRFVGVEDQYFLCTALPLARQQAEPIRVTYQPISLPVPNDPENRTRSFVAYSLRTPGPASVAFYMGPKDLDTLRAVDPELTGAIDFGIFRFLVVPLLQALKWINGYIGNYGWSIIVLTMFINLAMFPLRHRSMVSMRKMQSLQPEVKAIQDRYAKYKITDPERQKMNQEMMALYKQRGVNPASGCVPMLLTMPVLYAFYAMLAGSIELRGAPFVGWLHDLSLKDPYYVTPILMGGTMFWQQRMMPSTADPVQQKMFLLMPVIFTTMFLAAPSGLVLYWLVSNLLAIGQQYITNRMIGAPPPRQAPARPLKSVGQGRTRAS
jgi:YidC/Oxa1 family membrane protein insertase